jgi:alkylated DNA repair protein alkB family protein 6
MSNLPPGVSLPVSLEQARVKSLPASAFYISKFISEEEEALFLDKIASAPKPRWKQLTHRRLQTWPSDLVKNTLMDASLPPWLEEPVVSRLLLIPLSPADQDQDQDQDHTNIFTASPHQRPNHVLVNEYPPGVGIMPHKVCCIGGRNTWEN